MSSFLSALKIFSSLIFIPLDPPPFGLNNGFPNPSRNFREHLSHDLPTEKILSLLRSIHSRSLIPGYGHSKKNKLLDTLDIIIKWLQVS